MATALPTILGARLGETVVDARYNWDNSRRGTRACQVVQLTTSGCGFFEQAGKVIPVPAGRAMLFSTAEKSRYFHPGAGFDAWTFDWVTLDGLDDLWASMRAAHGSVVTLDCSGIAAALIEEIARLYRSNGSHDRFHVAEILFRLGTGLFRELEAQASAAADALTRGRALIDELHARPINIKEIAARIGLSREHFIREFSREYGTSPGSMLRELRLRHAKRLLDHTALSCAEVARRSGFTSAVHFGRAFRARYGHSPGQTRSTNRI
jgi:AraC-like DNA-binding protein